MINRSEGADGPSVLEEIDATANERALTDGTQLVDRDASKDLRFLQKRRAGQISSRKSTFKNTGNRSQVKDITQDNKARRLKNITSSKRIFKRKKNPNNNMCCHVRNSTQYT